MDKILKEIQNKVTQFVDGVITSERVAELFKSIQAIRLAYELDKAVAAKKDTETMLEPVSEEQFNLEENPSFGLTYRWIDAAEPKELEQASENISKGLLSRAEVMKKITTPTTNTHRIHHCNISPTPNFRTRDEK